MWCTPEGSRPSSPPSFPRLAPVCPALTALSVHCAVSHSLLAAFSTSCAAGSRPSLSPGLPGFQGYSRSPPQTAAQNTIWNGVRHHRNTGELSALLPQASFPRLSFTRLCAVIPRSPRAGQFGVLPCLSRIALVMCLVLLAGFGTMMDFLGSHSVHTRDAQIILLHLLPSGLLMVLRAKTLSWSNVAIMCSSLTLNTRAT